MQTPLYKMVEPFFIGPEYITGNQRINRAPERTIDMGKKKKLKKRIAELEGAVGYYKDECNRYHELFEGFRYCRDASGEIVAFRLTSPSGEATTYTPAGREHAGNNDLVLADTIGPMLSDDYTKRFCAEYWQAKIRESRLSDMLERAKRDELDFVPKCPLDLLRRQKRIMGEYLYILGRRAAIEDIDLLAARAEMLQ